MEFSRKEYWDGVPCPLPGDLPNPGIKPRSPALQADSLLSESPGKPKNTGVGSLALLQGIFLTQESNQGLLHYRQILYQLSYQGSPRYKRWFMGKESACNAGDLGSIPGLGRSHGRGHGNPLQYSCLENSMAEEPGGLHPIGAQRVKHNRSELASTYLYFLLSSIIVPLSSNIHLNNQ